MAGGVTLQLLAIRLSHVAPRLEHIKDHVSVAPTKVAAFVKAAEGESRTSEHQPFPTMTVYAPRCLRVVAGNVPGNSPTLPLAFSFSALQRLFNIRHHDSYSRRQARTAIMPQLIGYARPLVKAHAPSSEAVQAYLCSTTLVMASYIDPASSCCS